MKVLRRIWGAIAYQRVLKLANDGQYDRALALLTTFEGHGDYVSKKVLLEATINFRTRNFGRAEVLYNDFLSCGLKTIKNGEDKEYLLLYCKFYLQIIENRRDGGCEEGVSLKDLTRAAQNATYLTSGEFPPPR